MIADVICLGRVADVFFVTALNSVPCCCKCTQASGKCMLLPRGIGRVGRVVFSRRNVILTATYCNASKQGVGADECVYCGTCGLGDTGFTFRCPVVP